jgi:hypothetical protein
METTAARKRNEFQRAVCAGLLGICKAIERIIGEEKKRAG